MAILLNRKYGSRLECLYYILLSCYHNFSNNKSFGLKDLKFDSANKNNVHKYCQLLSNVLNRKCCPFLNNPLNLSKYYATQSIESDTTKSKAVSDVGGSLEALGFISKEGSKYLITKNGIKWINSKINTKEWEEIALNGVLSYGVIIGFLFRIKDLPDIFSYQGIYMSYPHTEETVKYVNTQNKKIYIDLSTDSQKDSNTRTMSRIIAWCVTVGLIEPLINTNNKSELAHVKYKDFINQNELVIRKFKKTKLYQSIINKKFYVDNPLSFTRLHKNVGSLRENGGTDLRNATLQFNSNILNRRFTFLYILNHFSENNKYLSISKLVEEMKKHSQYYFSNKKNANDIMATEIDIGYIAGLPFSIKDNDLLIPYSTINTKVLCYEAPSEILSITNKIIERLK